MGKTKVNYFFYILSIGLMMLIGLAMSLGGPIQEHNQKTNIVLAENIAYDEAFDLKDVTVCTATTVIINGLEYNTSGNTFYISDIDGLLTLSAIVGKINTSNTGHLGCGIDK